MSRFKKIDEAVAHVAAVFEVNRKIEEIVGTLVVNVDFIQQHLLIIFVRNVAHLWYII